MEKLGDEEKGGFPKPSFDYAATKEQVRELPRLSHYSIVNQMINYHAVDFGKNCESVALNDQASYLIHQSHLRRSQLDA